MGSISMGANPRSVAIVGAGRSHNVFSTWAMHAGSPKAPFDEVWTINMAGTVFPTDRWYCMDDYHEMLAGPPAYLEALKASRCPIYTSTPTPEIPMTVAFPAEDVARAVGYPYFNTSAAWAFGDAIRLEVPDVYLFGMDFVYPDEPYKGEAGRGCLEFLIGIARERGMRVHIAQSSNLMDTHTNHPPYGFPGKRWGQDEDGNLILVPDGVVSPGKE